MENLEKRQYRRFRVSYGSIVVFNKPFLFKLKNRVIKIGPLFDISKGGLSVTYIKDQLDFDDVETISLINWDDSIRTIKNLPVNCLRDEEIGTESGRYIRKRSMQFGELNSYQKARIAYFIYLLNESANDQRDHLLLKANENKFYRI